jgi:HEAT repeat protein
VDSVLPSDPIERRRAVVIAGHRGDLDTARAAFDDADAETRELSLGALQRLDALEDELLMAAMADHAVAVRRRAAELLALHPGCDPMPLLYDDDPSVVEVAAWACGEHEVVSDAVLSRLIALTTDADDPLVRESCAAALGAIGDPRGLPAILVACRDKPAVRRRSVLALAPFEGPEVDAALAAALEDRDWQVRQAAEDLTR